MKFVYALLLGMGVIVGDIASAEAVVCARGVYRAGCVGPRGGAVVVRRPVRCYWRAGVRICR
ncbi:hypothetical protein GJ654_13370 [Rhodoblastus acidophilus]|jgi:hypothetical protein|uniref:Uncharacterized protein n=1 Tax=Rhodoblastus acidophilus TaxID=1074 RepID=A0A6N8DNJ7_RHOAC|nr:hypothetical protein [Rhodoblastus acidophilus]MCW2275467.1 hypothetical protein [Rhodoblastus acidophilus]MTV31977.1 hypothetical protein [Rhodoblastus acidophilus]